jgi:hypothetical protein
MVSVLRQIDVNVAVRRVIRDEIKSVLSPADDRLDQESLAKFECEYSVPENVVASVDDNEVAALQSRLHAEKFLRHVIGKHPDERPVSYEHSNNSIASESFDKRQCLRRTTTTRVGRR